ncbi:hypothetical protein Aduo_009467 [Ancylostoma duodenale]
MIQNGVSNNIEDVIAKNAIQDVVVPTAKSELGKRKKSKKDKSKENVIMAENVPGHMGQLPVEQLVDLIEGKPEQNAKKQSAKEKPEVAAEEAIQTKKERRRKSKELKEAASPSASNAATIGASQTKTGGSTAATATASVPANASQPPKMEFTVASKRVTSPGSEKRRGKGAGAERNVRCSTEDGEEEFLSADEGVASSIGDDSSVPASMVASLAINTNLPKSTTASDVVLDGRNYRADDEDVTLIERQCADEQEFITVNTKKKKLVEFAGKQQQQQQRTGSAGKEERHQRAVAERLEPARRSSVGIAAESRNTAMNSPLPSGRRPTTASLADFLDEKDGGKIHNKTSSTVASKAVKKLHRNERQSQPDVEVPLPDLPSGTTEVQSFCAT